MIVNLNLLPPHIEPSAVGHIPEQIELIQRLIEKGKGLSGEGRFRLFQS